MFIPIPCSSFRLASWRVPYSPPNNSSLPRGLAIPICIGRGISFQLKRDSTDLKVKLQKENKFPFGQVSPTFEPVPSIPSSKEIQGTKGCLAKPCLRQRHGMTGNLFISSLPSSSPPPYSLPEDCYDKMEGVSSHPLLRNSSGAALPLP
jgi:hypothetical protein